MTHTKQVPCDGQTEKLACGCDRCLACGSYIMQNAVVASASNYHVHASVTYL